MKTTFPGLASQRQLELMPEKHSLYFKGCELLSRPVLLYEHFIFPLLVQGDIDPTLIRIHTMLWSSDTVCHVQLLSASASCILRKQSSHAQISLSNYLAQTKSSEVAVPMAVLLLKQSADSTWNHESFSSRPTSLVTNLCFLQPKDPDVC